jgi:hypothetical protein
MSKASNVPSSLNLYENEPFVFRRWMVGQLEGQLLTLVEAFGFEGKREDAVKSLVRNTIWDWFRNEMKPIPESKYEEFERIVDSIYTN